VSVSLEEHTRLATRVCFGAELDEEALAKLSAFGAEERWRTYRKMVRSRFVRVVSAAFPRTKRATGEEAFLSTITRWLDEAPPSTRYFRNVPAQWLAHARGERALDEPPWLEDLARYEHAQWDVKAVDDRDLPRATEISFERVPAVSPAVRLLETRYPVQKKRASYEEAPQRLCVYRGADFKAVTMELNPLAFALMQAWTTTTVPLTQSVQQVTQARDVAIDQTFIEGLATLLEDFLKRGILRGSLAPEET